MELDGAYDAVRRVADPAISARARELCDRRPQGDDHRAVRHSTEGAGREQYPRNAGGVAVSPTPERHRPGGVGGEASREPAPLGGSEAAVGDEPDGDRNGDRSQQAAVDLALGQHGGRPPVRVGSRRGGKPGRCSGPGTCGGASREALRIGGEEAAGRKFYWQRQARGKGSTLRGPNYCGEFHIRERSPCTGKENQRIGGPAARIRCRSPAWIASSPPSKR
jgi:hypothetical protein